MISFTVYGTPAPAGSKTAGISKAGRRFVRDSNPASKEWKRQVAQAAGETMAGRELLDGPLALTVEFFRARPKAHFGKKGLLPSAPIFPTTAPDTTKLVRAVEDAMQGIVYRNDSQIVTQVARKHYGEPARVEIRIRPIEHEQLRDLAWYLESNLKAATFGLIPFEAIFLAHFEGPEGKTIGDVLIPRIEQGQLALPPAGGTS